MTVTGRARVKEYAERIAPVSIPTQPGASRESLEQEKSMRQQRSALFFARALFALCVFSILTGLWFLKGTALGFLLAFGGTILGCEAYFLHSAVLKKRKGTPI